MELCDFDLKQYVKQTGDSSGRLSEGECRRVVTQVLNGLCFMQQRCQVMHRDIKLDNILVKRHGQKFEFKIGDLG